MPALPLKRIIAERRERQQRDVAVERQRREFERWCRQLHERWRCQQPELLAEQRQFEQRWFVKRWFFQRLVELRR